MLNKLVIPENRLKHCYTSGKVMQWCAKYLGYDSEEQMRMFFIGYIHDCMYDFEDDGLGNHDIIGAKNVAGSDMEYAVRYHMEVPLQEEFEITKITDLKPGVISFEKVGLFLLRFADEIVDGGGEIVGFDKRMEDLKARHKNDGVVEEALTMNNYLFERGGRELEEKCLEAFGIMLEVK